MLKKALVRVVCFILAILLAGCTCYEKEWRSRQQLREELSEKLPDAPDFPEYELDASTKKVRLKDFSAEDVKTARKRRKKTVAETEAISAVEAKPAAVDEKPPAEAETDTSIEDKTEDAVKRVEEAPVALAKKDVPEKPEKVAVPGKTEPAAAAEKAFFERWNGECLVYNVNWNFARVGKALIASKEASNGYGDVYHLVAVTVPEGIMASMGIGYYRIDAYLDKKTLLPYYYYQYSKNRNKEDILEIHFNWEKQSYRWRLRKMEKGKLYAVKTETVELKNSAYDGISSFYILRTLDFENRGEFSVPVALSEMWDLTVNKKDRRREQIPNFGTRDIFVVVPEAKCSSGLFTEGKMDIWLTADKKRLPVYLEGRVPLGTAKFSIAAEIQIPSDTVFDINTIANILSRVR